MKNNFIYLVAAIIIAVIIVIILKNVFEKNILADELDEEIEGYAEIQENSLEELCSSEEECIDFCLNNRGLCTSYCQENLENEFCQDYFSSTSPQNNNIIKEDTEDDCSNFYFTHYVVEPRFVEHFSQVGGVGGGNTEMLGTSYVFLKEEFTNQKIPVYAPAEMKLRAVSHYLPPEKKEDPNYISDKGLIFNFGCGYEMRLAHVKEVVEKIEVVMLPVSDSSADREVTAVSFEAGELIGYIHKTSSAASMDFIVENRNIKNKFINQERYDALFVGSNSVHRICPHDMYRAEIKDVYYALLPGNECGTMERDKIGTISGQWFLNPDPASGMGGVIFGAEATYGNPLPIVSDGTRITIGNMGPGNVMWVYPDNPTYKAPEEVTSEHCYQNYPNPNSPQGYVYFKIVDDMTMDVYYSEAGNCPSSFPSTGGKRYYR